MDSEHLSRPEEPTLPLVRSLSPMSPAYSERLCIWWPAHHRPLRRRSCHRIGCSPLRKSCPRPRMEIGSPSYPWEWQTLCALRCCRRGSSDAWKLSLKPHSGAKQLLRRDFSRNKCLPCPRPVPRAEEDHVTTETIGRFSAANGLGTWAYGVRSQGHRRLDRFDQCQPPPCAAECRALQHKCDR